jgi:3-oxoacyl-[acyl-carrier-protein] synthase-3
MYKSKIAGIGMYVPNRIVKNDDLTSLMETSDEWIVERTGIKERRYVERFKENTTTMAVQASKIAIERAGIQPNDIDFIVFATLSPDYYFPGCGVLLQRELGINNNCAALDVRNQCSGFVYGLSVADQFIKTGMYKNVLLVGSETHSAGLDFSTRGRNVSVIFGDGAGAVVLQPSDREDRGILSTHLHSEGLHAEKLAFLHLGAHSGVFTGDKSDFESSGEWGSLFVSQDMIDNGTNFPNMDGPFVFKNAVRRFPEVIMEALAKNNKTVSDINMLIPHQANLRIAQFIQEKMGLREDQVYNNITKYGNTTAASVPIALCEAWELGKIKDGDLVCLAAFGSGFTWGSALLNW